MKLVIAEKPMLARDIARAICGREVGEREKLPVSGNGWCVCALAGHVLELAEPSELRREWAWGKDFTEDMLPIYVPRWPKRPAAGKEGIGTVATRAKILEGLIGRGLLARKGKTIVSTPLGRQFYAAVPGDISGPDLTARWWLMQQDVAEGRAGTDAVQSDVAAVIRVHIADGAYRGATMPGAGPEVGRCPVCGGALLYRGKVVSCETNRSRRNEEGEWESLGGCGFKVFAVFCGKQLTANQMAKLLAGKRVRVSGLTWKGEAGKTAELAFDPPSRKITFAPRAGAKVGKGRKRPRAGLI